MAFNLKKVLKALLLSTNQPLGIKDIQAAFTRYHDQAAALPEADAEEAATPPATPSATDAGSSDADQGVSKTDALQGSQEGAPGGSTVPEADSPPEAAAAAPADAGQAPVATASEPAEISIEEIPKDPELYSDVPSLITATQIREAMDQIAAELRSADDGLLLIEGNNGYRIVTHPRFARWVRILRQEPPPVKLSQSAIETLAVIAYRQPVTRGEIETIRGVSAEAGINKLLERELIYVVGRADTPGRPIQYGTTDQFLEFVGIKSIDELPASDVLSSRQIDEWLKNSENAHTPNDSDMGLADEQLPLKAEGSGEPESSGDEPVTPAAEEQKEPAAETGGTSEAPAQP